MGLGIIFFILLLVLTVFVIVDPLNLKPLWQGYTATQTMPAGDSASTTSQTEALDAAGLTAEDVTFTPAEEACFVNLFGQTRVDEIKAGAMPTAQEMFQGQGCLE